MEGFKRTEVGVIPTDWDVATIGMLAETSSGTTPPRALKDRYYRNGHIHWVKTLDLNNSEIFATEERVTTAALSETCLRSYPVGTVLVAMYGGYNQIGRTGLLRIPAAINQALTAIKPNPHQLCSEYLLRVLNFRVAYWKVVASSSRKDPNITGKDIRDFSLALPSRAEQDAIAAALTDADALIESLEQLLAKKRLIKQGAMQELLTGKRRLPGFSAEWRSRPLGSLATIQRGASPRPIDSPQWFDPNSPIGWVRISDITQAAMYLRETTQRLSAKGVQHSRPVKRDSLIMSICATVGRPVITTFDTCIHDGFVVFEQPKVSQLFLYYALRFIEADWSRHGQTGSQMNLNTGLIHRTHILVPESPAEQAAIATALLDFDTEIAALEAKLAKSRLLKQAMMQELLTGRIRLVSPVGHSMAVSATE